MEEATGPCEVGLRMRLIMRIFMLLLIALIVASCASNQSGPDFDRLVLNHAREILDIGKLNQGTESSVVVAIPRGVSQQAWALAELSIHGDGSDITRCCRFLDSENEEIRDAAERSFVFLSRPNQSKGLIDLLEMNERLVHKLVLAYAGCNVVEISSADLQVLSSHPDKRVRELSCAVLRKQVELWNQKSI